MDILLVQLEKGMTHLFTPLGLLYLADALEKTGKTVEILHEQGTKAVIESLVEKAEREKPEWVGFSVMTGPQLFPTIEASKRLKEADVKVVWGGMHPTMIDGVEAEPYVDVAVKGEGEAWVTGKPVVNMDAFQPAWHLMDAEKYGTTLHLITSRGCPFNCGFCYSPAVWKRRWKAHSVGKVLEIFPSCPVEAEKVEFRDDNFFTDRKRAVAIVNELDIPWETTIRAPELTADLLESFKILPERLYVGAESASQRLLDLMCKDIKVEDVYDALNIAEKHGVKLFLTFIIDLPTETVEERNATTEMARNIERDYDIECPVKKFICYPRTGLFDLSVKLGFKPPRNTAEWARYALQMWDGERWGFKKDEEA